MTYIKVSWKHKNQSYPILLYSELDEDRMEVRKVELFLDGRMTYASGSKSMGNTILGEVALPSIEEIAVNDEFEPFGISKEEFESVWEKAISGYQGM